MYAWGYTRLEIICATRQIFVIPAEAGIQSTVLFKYWADWVPAAACPRMLQSGAGTTGFLGFTGYHERLTLITLRRPACGGPR